MTVRIVAEAGVNHNGDLATALRMVDLAAEAGADAVKFQTFDPAALVTPDAEPADYQKRNAPGTVSQRAMLEGLRLDAAAHRALLDRCAARGIAFLSTPFDPASLALLLELGVPALKLSSGDLTNGPLLLAAARSGRELILSTGMATLAEVEDALAVIAFGQLAPPDARPGRAAFRRAYAEARAADALAARVTLLHCVTEYPAPREAINLRAMDTLRAAFALPVGYSDHSDGIAIAVAAAARGAVMIEKHFTLDRSLPGPDHRASLEPDGFAAMVAAIREVEAALGDGRKVPAPCEAANARVARKSLVAARDLPAGHVLGEDDIRAMRPGDGRSPMDHWDLLGTALPMAKRTHERL